MNNWIINNVCNNQLGIGKVDRYAISIGEVEISFNDIASIKHIIYSSLSSAGKREAVKKKIFKKVFVLLKVLWH